MNSNIAPMLVELARYGFTVNLQNASEIQTALTAQSTRVLQFLAESEDVGVKAAVTMNKFCSSKIIRKLVEDNHDSLNLLIVISKNNKCSGDLIDDIARILANAKFWASLKEMIDYPNMENDTLLYLMNENEDFADYVAKHSARHEILTYYVTQMRSEVLLENPNTSTELVKFMSESDYFFPATQMATCPNAGKKTLESLDDTGVQDYNNKDISDKT